MIPITITQVGALASQSLRPQRYNIALVLSSSNSVCFTNKETLHQESHTVNYKLNTVTNPLL